MSVAPFYRRRFLNRRGHHAGAYVIADLQVERWRDGAESGQAIYADLTVADCSRIARLDFSARNAAELTNALSKARTLLTVLTEFTAALEAAADQVDLPKRADRC